ncbi:MAG: hypothetical protein NT145_07905 [Elusimicrobia bacterium]|nr:hypothetical protein [Elusimicrobiota bacterium]
MPGETILNNAIEQFKQEQSKKDESLSGSETAETTVAGQEPEKSHETLDETKSQLLSQETPTDDEIIDFLDKNGELLKANNVKLIEADDILLKFRKDNHRLPDLKEFKNEIEVIKKFREKNKQLLTDQHILSSDELNVLIKFEKQNNYIPEKVELEIAIAFDAHIKERNPNVPGTLIPTKDQVDTIKSHVGPGFGAKKAVRFQLSRWKWLTNKPMTKPATYDKFRSVYNLFYRSKPLPENWQGLAQYAKLKRKVEIFFAPFFEVFSFVFNPVGFLRAHTPAKARKIGVAVIWSSAVGMGMVPWVILGISWIALGWSILAVFLSNMILHSIYNIFFGTGTKANAPLAIEIKDENAARELIKTKCYEKFGHQPEDWETEMILDALKCKPNNTAIGDAIENFLNHEQELRNLFIKKFHQPPMPGELEVLFNITAAADDDKFSETVGQLLEETGKAELEKLVVRKEIKVLFAKELNNIYEKYLSVTNIEKNEFIRSLSIQYEANLKTEEHTAVFKDLVSNLKLDDSTKLLILKKIIFLAYFLPIKVKKHFEVTEEPVEYAGMYLVRVKKIGKAGSEKTLVVPLNDSAEAKLALEVAVYETLGGYGGIPIIEKFYGADEYGALALLFDQVVDLDTFTMTFELVNSYINRKKGEGKIKYEEIKKAVLSDIEIVKNKTKLPPGKIKALIFMVISYYAAQDDKTFEESLEDVLSSKKIQEAVGRQLTKVSTYDKFCPVYKLFTGKELPKGWQDWLRYSALKRKVQIFFAPVVEVLSFVFNSIGFLLDHFERKTQRSLVFEIFLIALSFAIGLLFPMQWIAVVGLSLSNILNGIYSLIVKANLEKNIGSVKKGIEELNKLELAKNPPLEEFQTLSNIIEKMKPEVLKNQKILSAIAEKIDVIIGIRKDSFGEEQPALRTIFGANSSISKTICTIIKTIYADRDIDKYDLSYRIGKIMENEQKDFYNKKTFSEFGKDEIWTSEYVIGMAKRQKFVDMVNSAVEKELNTNQIHDKKIDKSEIYRTIGVAVILGITIVSAVIFPVLPFIGPAVEFISLLITNILSLIGIQISGIMLVILQSLIAAGIVNIFSHFIYQLTKGEQYNIESLPKELGIWLNTLRNVISLEWLEHFKKTTFEGTNKFSRGINPFVFASLESDGAILNKELSGIKILALADNIEKLSPLGYSVTFKTDEGKVIKSAVWAKNDDGSLAIYLDMRELPADKKETFFQEAVKDIITQLGGAYGLSGNRNILEILSGLGIKEFSSWDFSNPVLITSDAEINQWKKNDSFAINFPRVPIVSLESFKQFSPGEAKEFIANLSALKNNHALTKSGQTILKTKVPSIAKAYKEGEALKLGNVSRLFNANIFTSINGNFKSSNKGYREGFIDNEHFFGRKVIAGYFNIRNIKTLNNEEIKEISNTLGIDGLYFDFGNETITNEDAKNFINDILGEIRADVVINIYFGNKKFAKGIFPERVKTVIKKSVKEQGFSKYFSSDNIYEISIDNDITDGELIKVFQEISNIPSSISLIFDLEKLKKAAGNIRDVLDEKLFIINILKNLNCILKTPEEKITYERNFVKNMETKYFPKMSETEEENEKIFETLEKTLDMIKTGNLANGKTEELLKIFRPESFIGLHLKELYNGEKPDTVSLKAFINALLEMMLVKQAKPGFEFADIRMREKLGKALYEQRINGKTKDKNEIENKLIKLNALITKLNTEKFYRAVDKNISELELEIASTGTSAEQKAVARDAMIEIIKLWSEPKWKKKINKTPQSIDTEKVKNILSAA